MLVRMGGVKIGGSSPVRAPSPPAMPIQLVPKPVFDSPAEQAKAVAKAMRDLVLNDGFFFRDHWFDSDWRAELNLITTVGQLTSGSSKGVTFSFPFYWIDIENHSVQINEKSDMSAMLSAFTERKGLVFGNYHMLKVAIEVADDPMTVPFTKNWPPIRTDINALLEKAKTDVLG